MAEKRLSICGAILLGLILLVAVFSLGVYVGRYGLNREGLSYAGGGQPGGQMPAQGVPQQPGQMPGPQQAVPNAPQPLPPGLDSPPQLIGRIIHISPDGLDLAAQDGLRPVQLTRETVFEDSEGNALALRDLARGNVVGVYGELSGEGAGRTFTAARIVVLPVQSEP
jgi:hypothetical protein